MKKLLVLTLTGLMVLSTGIMSFADSSTSPAEIYADSVGISVEEAYSQRSDGQRFGDLARENDVWEAFSEKFMARKIDALNDKVANGDLTQEEADALIAALDDCDGTGDAQVLRGMNMGFGQGSGLGQGNGYGTKSGNGLRDGSGGGRGQGNGNGLRDGSGQGNGYGLGDGTCLID